METETMSSVLASVSTRKEKAAKAMAALHSHRSLISACITDWENLERSFGVTERALQQKFKELVERETEFDAKMQEARAALQKREESIAGREEASLARVKEQKDTAVAGISEERRNLEEEWMKWRAEKGISAEEADLLSKAAGQDKVHIAAPIKVIDHDARKDHKDKEKQAQKQDHSATKPSKDTKDVLQKKGSSSSKSVRDDFMNKDTRSAGSGDKKKADFPGPEKKDPETKQGIKKDDSLEQPSKNKRKDHTVDDEATIKRRKEASKFDTKAVAESGKGGTMKNTPSLEEAIKMVKQAAEPPAPGQIKFLVEKLDHEGLKDFFIHNRKELHKLRPDLQGALQASSDPCRLSLKILELSEGVDRVSASNKCGHSCILLLECLSEVIADPVLGVDFPVVPSDVKEIARILARRWKSLLERHPHENHALSSHLFLQLLATFGIGTDYTAEDLLKYVVFMSRRGVGPPLCRTLGLTERIPVVVDRLIKDGKQIDAIGYACAFGLLDRYKPGTLFRSYIEDSEKRFVAEKTASMGGNMGELYTKQIAAYKNAIKVLEDHKLNTQLPLEELRNRVSTLKQERLAIKKSGTNSKQENQSDKAPNETESARANGIKSAGANSRAGFDSAHEMHGGYISSLERGDYAPTDLGRRVDYTPTDIGKPLFPPYSHDRLNRMPESKYDEYGFGSRSPVSLSGSNLYVRRDGIGSHSRDPASSLPGAGVHSYSRLPRDDADMLFPSSRSRLPYSEIHGPSSNYHPGSSLPPSSSYLPYYLR
ncbi:hypothetical protein L7F22_020940 [Adiantum nelumboides]|nr:hypothetical protein [Adiantum nelumboides]